MVCLLSPLGLSSAKAHEPILTEFQYLQWLAQIAGATPLLPPNPTAADYVAWATAAGIVPAGGWNPNAPMTPAIYADTIADLLGLMVSPSGHVHDGVDEALKRALEKDNIHIPGKITLKELVHSIDHSQFGNHPKKSHTTGDHTSKPPDKPPTHDGNGGPGHHTTDKPKKDTHK